MSDVTRLASQGRMELFDQLSERQIEALCNVAFGGNGGGQNRRTLESLVRWKVIERVTVPDGPFSHRFEWEMPAAVHIDFCAWCATHAEEPA
jgi:hypothetical protein